MSEQLISKVDQATVERKAVEKQIKDAEAQAARRAPFAERTVTGTISPAMIQDLRDPGYDNQHAEAGREVLAAAREKLRVAYSYEAAVKNDPSFTPEAAELESYDVIAAATEQVQDLLRKHCDSFATRIAQAEQHMVQASRPAPSQRKASVDAILGHIKSLPEEKRIAFLMERVGRGDFETVSTVVETHDYLSGLEKVDRKFLADLPLRAAAVSRPADVKRIAELRRVHDKLVMANAAAETPSEPATVAVARRQRAYTAAARGALKK